MEDSQKEGRKLSFNLKGDGKMGENLGVGKIDGRESNGEKKKELFDRRLQLDGGELGCMGEGKIDRREAGESKGGKKKSYMKVQLDGDREKKVQIGQREEHSWIRD